MNEALLSCSSLLMIFTEARANKDRVEDLFLRATGATWLVDP